MNDDRFFDLAANLSRKAARKPEFYRPANTPDLAQNRLERDRQGNGGAEVPPNAQSASRPLDSRLCRRCGFFSCLCGTQVFEAWFNEVNS